MKKILKIAGWIALFFFVVLLCILLWLHFSEQELKNEVLEDIEKTEYDGNSSDVVSESDPAIEAGVGLSHGNCEGSGPVVLGTSPMKLEDFAFIEPYGLMVGGHVTPIDHEYFSPTIFNSPPDTYEVRAMADGRIVDIQRRVRDVDGEVDDEFRIVFTHTCTFFTYFDLVTSLEPSILAEYEKIESNNYAAVDIKVEEGQLIGWIGGRTLDFAVWDTEKPLSGFVVPEHYKNEAWKIYTADPYLYYSDELREQLTAKNLRTIEPIAGRIDYDIDGKLIGNWFVEGTAGYEGVGAENYWESHLSFVPNHLDPTAFMVSTGDFDGNPGQFAISGNTPNPADVDVSHGLVKYELADFEFIEPSGGIWDRDSLVRGLTLRDTYQINGVVLVEMLEDRKIKVEFFPGMRSNQVSGFTGQAKIYER